MHKGPAALSFFKLRQTGVLYAVHIIFSSSFHVAFKVIYLYLRFFRPPAFFVYKKMILYICLHDKFSY